MFKILRIICSVASALFAAACIFLFVYLGPVWGFSCVGVVILFFGLTVLFKNLQVKQELKDNPPPPSGDFITGRVPAAKDSTEEHKDENSSKE